MTDTTNRRTPVRKLAATLAMAGILTGMVVASPFSAGPATASDYCAPTAPKNLAISGKVWQDDDKSRTFSSTETGVEGVELTVYHHQLKPSHSSRVVGEVTTQADGTYTMYQLCAGYYSVEITGKLPNGYTAERTTRSIGMTSSGSGMNFPLDYAASDAVAKDVVPDATNFAEMQWAVDGGFFDIGDDELFRPSDTVKRGEGAMVIHRALVDRAASPPPYSPFSDLDAEDDRYGAVAWMVQEGIVHGHANLTFGVDAVMSRGEMAVMLYRAAAPEGFSSPSTPPFSDVPKSSTYYDATAWMASKGISNGYSNGTFGVSTSLSRKEMAILLYRFDQKFGGQFQ